MRISIAISILILLVAALFGIPAHQRLNTIRTNHAKLVAEAAELGISIDPKHPAAAVRSTKRPREDKLAVAKKFAAELISFAKEMESRESQSTPPDEAQQKRGTLIMEQIMALDAAQLKLLVAEFRAAKDLKEETRQELISFALMTLANDHPQAALQLFVETPELTGDRSMSNHLVPSTLAKLAREDPLAAVDWLKKNANKVPDSDSDGIKNGLIAGVAASDTKLAFKLIGELGLKETWQAVNSIIRAAKTPADQTATLIALREHLAGIPDEKARKEFAERAINRFADTIAEAGFEAGTKWIAESKLTPTELGIIARGLQGSVKSAESGRWIEWIGEKLPANEAGGAINRLVRDWTRNDYQAAGKWLNDATPGPAKNAAVSSYAETLAEYEPASAAQWALTLPPGTDRDKTLKRIYQNWPESDSAAKEAFKHQHGIK